MIIHLLAPCLFFSQTLASEPVKAADLKVIPGPTAPRYPDPALAPGTDRLGLTLRRAARHGSLPTVEVPTGTQVVEDRMVGQAGWKAYLVQAPPGATVKVRLKGEHTAWYWMTAVDKWGRSSAGMLQNRIKTGNPEASFINPRKDRVSSVYFVVDTHEMNMSETYTLTFTWE